MTTTMPHRRPSGQSHRLASLDTRDEIQIYLDHYIGIDVGTGSARACIIDGNGDIVGLATENIGLWQPQQGFYVGIVVPIVLELPLTITHRSNRPLTSGVVSA